MALPAGTDKLAPATLPVHGEEYRIRRGRGYLDGRWGTINEAIAAGLRDALDTGLTCYVERITRHDPYPYKSRLTAPWTETVTASVMIPGPEDAWATVLHYDRYHAIEGGYSPATITLPDARYHRRLGRHEA